MEWHETFGGAGDLETQNNGPFLLLFAFPREGEVYWSGEISEDKSPRWPTASGDEWPESRIGKDRESLRGGGGG